MRKDELKKAVSAAKQETAAALQLVYDSLNQGQQKKLLKQETVVCLLQRYGVKI